MAIAYKLTNESGKTMFNTQWGEGVEHRTSGEGELCSPGWLHVYQDPFLAVAMNPVHANFDHPRLWECEVGGKERYDGELKSGYSRVKTVKELSVPVLTGETLFRWAITCAMPNILINIPRSPWLGWAWSWLSGRDRSAESMERMGVYHWAPSEGYPVRRLAAGKVISAVHDVYPRDMHIRVIELLHAAMKAEQGLDAALPRPLKG